jgi:hypothetical protein
MFHTHHQYTYNRGMIFATVYIVNCLACVFSTELTSAWWGFYPKLRPLRLAASLFILNPVPLKIWAVVQLTDHSTKPFKFSLPRELIDQ